LIRRLDNQGRLKGKSSRSQSQGVGVPDIIAVVKTAKQPVWITEGCHVCGRHDASHARARPRRRAMKNLTRVALGLGIFAVVMSLAFAKHPGAHMMVLPADLKWSNFPSLPPGAKIASIEGSIGQAVPYTVRLKFPKDYAIPPHSHPVIARVTVVSGTFHMGTGEKLDKSKSHALPPGAIAITRPGTNHFAWTAEEVIVQLNGVGPWDISYVDPVDDPRRKNIQLNAIRPWGMPHADAAGDPRRK
jgi:quercetin dioxygenase-like cupin family protein